MAEEVRENVPELTFAKAYDFILRDTRLNASEKLVLIEVCRFWPKPCWKSNGHIAQGIGLSEAYVRNLISGLTRRRGERKAYLWRRYARRMNGEDTRLLSCLCFPDGRTASQPQRSRRQSGGCLPACDGVIAGVRKPSRGQSPIISCKIEEIDEKIRVTAASPAPSPIGAAASAAGNGSNERAHHTGTADRAEIPRQDSEPGSVPPARLCSALTEAEKEQRKQMILRQWKTEK